MIMNGGTRPRKVAGGKRQGVKSVDSEIHVPTSWQGIVEIILRGILLVLFLVVLISSIIVLVSVGFVVGSDSTIELIREGAGWLLLPSAIGLIYEVIIIWQHCCGKKYTYKFFVTIFVTIFLTVDFGVHLALIIGLLIGALALAIYMIPFWNITGGVASTSGQQSLQLFNSSTAVAAHARLVNSSITDLVFCFSSIIALVVVMVFMAMVGGSVLKEEPKRSRLYRGSRQATNRGRKSTIPARFVPLGSSTPGPDATSSQDLQGELAGIKNPAYKDDFHVDQEREAVVLALQRQSDDGEQIEDLHSQLRRDLADGLPQEPTEEDSQAMSISVRLPDGNQVSRRFSSCDTIENLYAFTGSQSQINPQNFQLRIKFDDSPHPTLLDRSSVPLVELGFQTQTLIVVEADTTQVPLHNITEEESAPMTEESTHLIEESTHSTEDSASHNA